MRLTLCYALASLSMICFAQVSISPLSPPPVKAGETLQFSATSATTSVTWILQSPTSGLAPLGTISQTGLYTAPDSVPVTSFVMVVASGNGGLSVRLQIDPGSTPPTKVVLGQTPVQFSSVFEQTVTASTTSNSITIPSICKYLMVFRNGTNLYLNSDYTITGTTLNTSVTQGDRFKFVCFSSQSPSLPAPVSTTYAISGRMALNGTALSGVNMALSGGGSSATTAQTISTDATGMYTFAGLTAGKNYTITPSLTGHTFLPAVVTVSGISANKTVNFSATATISTFAIAGQITVSGVGLNGVAVSLVGGSTTNTDSTGNYSFTSLPGGATYTLTPVLSGFTFSPTSQTITGLSGNQIINFTATANSVIVGNLPVITHTGNFTQGQLGTWVVNVSNTSALTTSDALTLTDKLPANYTLADFNGDHWNCSSDQLGDVTCTNVDIMPAGTSYQPLNLIVNVPSNSPALIQNSVIASGGGMTNPITSNPDPVTVNMTASLVEVPCAGTASLPGWGIDPTLKYCRESITSANTLQPVSYTNYYGSHVAYGLSCPINAILQIKDSTGLLWAPMPWMKISDLVYWGSTIGDPLPAYTGQPQSEWKSSATGLPPNWFAAMNFVVSSNNLVITYTSTDPTCTVPSQLH